MILPCLPAALTAWFLRLPAIVENLLVGDLLRLHFLGCTDSEEIEESDCMYTLVLEVVHAIKGELTQQNKRNAPAGTLHLGRWNEIDVLRTRHMVPCQLCPVNILRRCGKHHGG